MDNNRESGGMDNLHFFLFLIVFMGAAVFITLVFSEHGRLTLLSFWHWAQTAGQVVLRWGYEKIIFLVNLACQFFHQNYHVP